MKAALLHGIGDIKLGDIPEIVANKSELLLRIKVVSVCGSDLHYYHEGGIGDAKIHDPLVLGHEFSAEIIDDRAEEYGFEPGTLVAVDPALPCDNCEWCHKGYRNLCPNVRFTGAPPYDGALRQYLSAKPDLLYPVPATFDAEIAALLEPLGVAIHALDLAHLKPMASIAVLGAGPIGLLLLQVARHSGAGDIYVIDPLEYRAQAALRLGATKVALDHREIDAWTNGRGVDVVLEATNSPLGPQHAAEAVSIGGKIILVGIPDGDQVSLTASLIRRKGLTIKLSRRMGNVYPRAIYMVEQGLIDLKSLVTHRYSLAQTKEAFARQASYADNVLKSVIYCDQD